MMGVKAPRVKEPDRKRSRNAAVPVSEGMDRDKAVMGDSSCYDGMQGLRCRGIYPFDEGYCKRPGIIRWRRCIDRNASMVHYPVGAGLVMSRLLVWQDLAGKNQVQMQKI